MGTKQSRVGGDQSASSAAVGRAVRPPWKLEEVRETVQCLGRGRSEQETPPVQSPGQVCGAVRGAELLVEGGEAKGPGGARRTSLCEDPASSCRVWSRGGLSLDFFKGSFKLPR